MRINSAAFSRIFFFSSRRRHTRSTRDWSSDCALPIYIEGHHSPTPLQPRVALSGELGLNHPKSVAAVDDLLEERFYIADTGNNRVILIKLPSDNPEDRKSVV